MRTLNVCLFLIALLPGIARGEAYGSGWYAQIEAVIGYEDNISRSFLGRDQLSDTTAYLSLGGGYSRKIGKNSQLVLSSYIGIQQHDKFEDLNRISTSVAMDYIFQPQVAYAAPWYRIKVEAINLSYKKSDAREGLLARLDASVNRRLSPTVTGHLGYRYDDLIFINKTKAEEVQHAAFDIATHELYAGFDHQWRSRISLYGEYAFRHGGAHSNQSFSAGIVQYDAETIDWVFDDCAPTDFRCQPRYSGRIVSDIHTVSLGLSVPFRALNLDFSGRYYRANGDNGESYSDWYVSAGVIWSF